jgi:hypothetical protein
MVAPESGVWLQWSEEEDRRLLVAVERARDSFGRIRWDAVETLPNRSSISMQKRLYAIKNNATKSHGYPRNPAWSAAETATLTAAVEGQAKVDWQAVAESLPGRTPEACYARWQHMHALRKSHVAVVHSPRTVFRPEQAATPCSRLCLSCRRPFDSWDRKRNWMCQNCRHHTGSTLE